MASVGAQLVHVPKSDGVFVELDIDDPTWLELVSRAGTLAFHHPRWARMLGECYGDRPRVFASQGRDGTLLAGLPVLEVRRFGRTKWISLPFSDYCPIVADSSTERHRFERLLAAAVSSAPKISLEIRSRLDFGQSSADAVMHTLELERDPSAVFSRFKRTQVRQRITKAEREGVTVRRGSTPEDLTRIFYGLHVTTRRRLGVPVQPHRFFELVWREIVDRGLGSVLIAELDGRPIAAAVFLAWGSTTTYKYSASDPAYWSLRANNLVLSHAIRTACEGGYRTFDFGRTDASNRGLREFKLGWGTTEHELAYTYFGSRSPGSVGAGRLHGLGGAIIRHSPAFVCRASGELLYRYAA